MLGVYVLVIVSIFVPSTSFVSVLGHSRHSCLNMVTSSPKKASGNRPRKIVKKPRWTPEEREIYAESSQIYDNQRENSAQDRKTGSRDAWDVFVDRLDDSKGRKGAAGKMAHTKDSTVDELQCVHYAECSGCSRKGNFDQTPMVQRATRFFASEDVPMKVHLGPIHGWRSHVKLAVRPLSRWGGLKFGLYKANSHEVSPLWKEYTL
jgi:hypothetical protein